MRKAFVGRVGNREIGMIEEGPEGQPFGYRSRECEGEGNDWKTLYQSAEGNDEKLAEMLPVVPAAGIDENTVVGESLELGGRKWIVRENTVI